MTMRGHETVQTGAGPQSGALSRARLRGCGIDGNERLTTITGAALLVLLVLSTLIVLGSGLILLFEGPTSRSKWLPVHRITFFVWLAFVAAHVLGHLTSLPVALRGDFDLRAKGTEAVAGRDGRALALAGAIVGGAVLAIVLMPDFAAWMNAHFHHHRFRH